MADQDVATRTPESDAAEQSIIPGESVVDQGASLGKHCVADRPTPSGQSPSGEMTKFGDIEAYITRPADYPHSPSKLLLLLTSGTGIHSTNNQLQADRFASEGFLVVMPDQFGGDAAPGSTNVVSGETTATTTAARDRSASFIEQVKMGIAEAAKSFTIDMWLARHTPATVMPRLKSVVAAVKEEFADAVANGGGIYAVGYCFGGKYVMLLASDERGDEAKDQSRAAEEGVVERGPMIKAGILAHGTLIEKSDFDKVKAPLGIVAVENDALFSDEVREEGVKTLKEKGVDVQSWVYPGVPHGFAVLGDYQDQTIQRAQEQAFDVMLGWLKEH